VLTVRRIQALPYCRNIIPLNHEELRLRERTPNLAIAIAIEIHGVEIGNSLGNKIEQSKCKSMPSAFLLCSCAQSSIFYLDIELLSPCYSTLRILLDSTREYSLQRCA
jgi:hypothetical protein